MAAIPVHIVLFVQLLTLLIASTYVIHINCTVDVGEESEVGPTGEGLGSYQREFDYFKLALQWPGTICRRTHWCCSSNGCCHGSNSLLEFTIHGLWPDYNDGTWPACCSGPRFDSKEISTMDDALEKYWPSLSCSSPSTCHGGRGTFWAHEVFMSVICIPYHFNLLGDLEEKHGTCSSSVVHDEYNYFLTTLNVYFKYNVTEVLNEAGYAPSNSEKYPLGGIISAIQNAFHATPEIQCKGDAIEELRLCFFKDFKPRDCFSEPHSESYLVASKISCPKYVSLPAVQRENKDLLTRDWPF